jgi:hypothetical protein
MNMTTFLGPDEATNVDLAESRYKRNKDHVACFLHLRDLVYLHPQAATASAVSVVQTLETKVIAAKAAREKRLAEARVREAGRRYAADRQAAEQAKAEKEKTEQATADDGAARASSNAIDANREQVESVG